MNHIQKKYPYFWILAEINAQFALDPSLKNILSNTNPLDNIRPKSYENVPYLNNLFKKFFKILIKSEDNNEKLIALLSVTGVTLYLQPFYEGNSRTLKHFISIILKKLNYDYTFNHEDFIIPMLYEGEEATLNDLKKLQMKIKS